MKLPNVDPAIDAELSSKNMSGDHEKSSSRNVLDSMDEILGPGVELLD
jgi:hypothetical protein